MESLCPQKGHKETACFKAIIRFLSLKTIIDLNSYTTRCGKHPTDSDSLTGPDFISVLDYTAAVLCYLGQSPFPVVLKYRPLRPRCLKPPNQPPPLRSTHVHCAWTLVLRAFKGVVLH